MLAAVFASGLLLHVADGFDADGSFARLNAAKAAYGRCIFERANEMYHGSDNPGLERAVMDACRSELSTYEDVAVGGAAGRSAFESTMPAVVHMFVQAVAGCKKDEAHLSASDRSLCATGGY